MLEQTSELG